MDHRCLYGHRVPAAFAFAIQSRACPTCGAPTVTVTGYQAARKLTTEVGLEAVTAFNAIRVLEAEWALTPVTAEPAPAPSAGTALAAAAPNVAAEEEEVVVVDEPAVVPPPPVVPAPVSVRASPKAEDAKPRSLSRPEPRVVAPPAAPDPTRSETSPRGEVPSARGYPEDDFFNRT